MPAAIRVNCSGPTILPMKTNESKKRRLFEITAGLFLLGASMCSSLALAAVLALPFAWLWNRTVAPVLHVSPIGYWQSLELLLLVLIIRVVAQGITVAAEPRDS